MTESSSPSISSNKIEQEYPHKIYVRATITLAYDKPTWDIFFRSGLHRYKRDRPVTVETELTDNEFKRLRAVLDHKPEPRTKP